MADAPEAKEPVKPAVVKPVPPARPKRIYVDEVRDAHVSSGYSTVIFRPGQLLESPHLVELARHNGILLREV